MKTITNEIKAKYFALYYGQKVLYNGCDTVVVNGSYNWLHSSHILVLTPLEHISDDDAIEVAEILYESVTRDTSIKNGKRIADDIIEGFIGDEFKASDYIRAIDYLRSKSYTLPYLDYSVNNLIELGLIKLK